MKNKKITNALNEFEKELVADVDISSIQSASGLNLLLFILLPLLALGFIGLMVFLFGFGGIAKIRALFSKKKK